MDTATKQLNETHKCQAETADKEKDPNDKPIDHPDMDSKDAEFYRLNDCHVDLNYLQRFPMEIQVAIAWYLNPRDLIHLALTAKYFNENFCESDPHFLWKGFYQRNLSIVILPPEGSGYRQTFQQAMRWLIPNWKGDPRAVRTFIIESGYELVLYQYIGSNRTPGQLNLLLREIIPTARLDIIDRLISLGANDLNTGLTLAVNIGDLSLVEYFVEKIKAGYLDKYERPDFDRALITASLHGHPDIVERMVILGANDYARALSEAARGGHLDIVKRLITLKANQGQPFALRELNYALVSSAFIKQSEEPADLTTRLNILEDLLNRGANDFDATMISAAKFGNREVVTRMVARGATSFNETMIAAAQDDHRTIIEQMIQLGATNFNSTMRAAVTKQCHLGLIQRMLDLGATNFNSTFLGAAMSGHLQVVKWMVQEKEQRPNISAPLNFDLALGHAAFGGYRDIVNYLVSLGHTGPHDFNGAMIRACAHTRNLEIVNRLIELGANNFDHGLLYAAAGGAGNVVNRMLELGATDYDRALIVAAGNGHLKIMNQMIELRQPSAGPDVFNEALLHVAKYHRSFLIGTVTRLIEKGATNIGEALHLATQCGHPKMVRYLQSVIGTPN